MNISKTSASFFALSIVINAVFNSSAMIASREAKKQFDKLTSTVIKKIDWSHVNWPAIKHQAKFGALIIGGITWAPFLLTAIQKDETPLTLTLGATKIGKALIGWSIFTGTAAVLKCYYGPLALKDFGLAPQIQNTSQESSSILQSNKAPMVSLKVNENTFQNIVDLSKKIDFYADLNSASDQSIKTGLSFIVSYQSKRFSNKPKDLYSKAISEIKSSKKVFITPNFNKFIHLVLQLKPIKKEVNPFEKEVDLFQREVSPSLDGLPEELLFIIHSLIIESQRKELYERFSGLALDEAEAVMEYSFNYHLNSACFIPVPKNYFKQIESDSFGIVDKSKLTEINKLASYLRYFKLYENNHINFDGTSFNIKVINENSERKTPLFELPFLFPKENPEQSISFTHSIRASHNPASNTFFINDDKNKEELESKNIGVSSQLFNLLEQLKALGYPIVLQATESNTSQYN